jgi:hypothetical protein
MDSGSSLQAAVSIVGRSPSRDQRCAPVAGARLSSLSNCLASANLYTYTVVHIGRPGWSLPYDIGYVDLPEGVRICAPIDRNANELRVGAKVRLVAGELRRNPKGEVAVGLTMPALYAMRARGYMHENGVSADLVVVLLDQAKGDPNACLSVDQYGPKSCCRLHSCIHWSACALRHGARDPQRVRT